MSNRFSHNSSRNYANFGPLSREFEFEDVLRTLGAKLQRALRPWGSYDGLEYVLFDVDEDTGDPTASFGLGISFESQRDRTEPYAVFTVVLNTAEGLEDTIDLSRPRTTKFKLQKIGTPKDSEELEVGYSNFDKVLKKRFTKSQELFDGSPNPIKTYEDLILNGEEIPLRLPIDYHSEPSADEIAPSED